MEELYGFEEWFVEEKNKCCEMVLLDVCYIFVKQLCSNFIEILFMDWSNNLLWKGEGDFIVVFVYYRFVVEYEVLVLYVYEI